MKYELIKEYPGSPELGTEVEKESNSKSSSSYFYRSGDKRICVLNYHVEENPEYWQKVNDNIWWCVWENDHIQDNSVYFKSWTPYQIECIQLHDMCRHYFKTKEEAEEFILYNKPCLSYNDVKEEMRCQVSQYGILESIRGIVKSKL